MCGRFLLEADIEDLLKYYNIAGGSVSAVPQKMVFPKQSTPAIIMHSDTSRLGLMAWGFVQPQLSKPIINGRSETLHVKPMFKDAFAKRRCVVPATAYYEWNAAKSPFTFYPIDAPILSLAGLYAKGSDGIWRFVLLTREAEGEAAKVHNRMPVMVKQEDILPWLSASTPMDHIRALTQTAVMPLEIVSGLLETTR